MSNEQACFILGKIARSLFTRSLCLAPTLANTLRVLHAFSIHDEAVPFDVNESPRNTLRKIKYKKKQMAQEADETHRNQVKGQFELAFSCDLSTHCHNIRINDTTTFEIHANEFETSM